MTTLKLLIAGLVLATWPVRADELQDLKQENADLRRRLDQVERALQELSRRWPAPAAATAPEFTDQEIGKLKELAAAPGKPVRAAFDLKLYGLVKLDAAYDDSRVNVGNFARWVESESVLKNDEQFNLTANQTRLGVDIAGPQLNGVRTSGKVEADFYGAGTGENKPELMLRHAYVQADWPDWRFSAIAGQTFDIISPLYPNTVNYSVGWWQGNVGYRRPQLRLVKTIGLSEQVDLKLEGGISRTITGRKYGFKESTDPDTGADAGFPTTAGRVSLTFPVWNKQAATIGVSGHYGGEEIHATNLVSSTDYDTWSVNVDVRLPITKWLLVQAEGFIGENFDSHLGGIGQGIDATRQDEVNTLGGWVAATLTPNPTWQFNLGAGVDNPDNGDLSAGTTTTNDPRTSNYFVFGNAFYTLTTNLQLALEVSYLRTTYKSFASGDAWREQFAVIYKF